MLLCDQVILELIRIAPNAARVAQMTERLAAFEVVPTALDAWARAREVQRLLAAEDLHRRVPPADLLIAAAAEAADVEIVHYDRDYERIAACTGQRHRWFVPDGSLVAR